MSNPFERLRALARWSGDDDELACEAATALAALAGEPGLVVGCRRMLAHHPDAATLWWVLAHVLASPEPRAAARACRDALDGDRTSDRLAAALPLQDDGELLAVVGWPTAADRALAERADIDVVAVRIDGIDPTWALRGRTTDRRVRVVEPWECSTLGVARLLVPVIALDDRHAVVPAALEELLWECPTAEVWLLAGIGRVLPRPLLDALVGACACVDDVDARVAVSTLGYDRVARVVVPRGAEAPADAVAGHVCPVPAELLRPF